MTVKHDNDIYVTNNYDHNFKGYCIIYPKSYCEVATAGIIDDGKEAGTIDDGKGVGTIDDGKEAGTIDDGKGAGTIDDEKGAGTTGSGIILSVDMYDDYYRGMSLGIVHF
jgi:hypothetical protein